MKYNAFQGRMQNVVFLLLTAAILATATTMGLAVSTETPPTAWLADATESEIVEAVTFTVGEGSITMSFAAQPGPPKYTTATIVADAGSPDSPFVGDYVSSGVAALTFRIAGSGSLPRSAYVMLQGSSGRRWYNRSVTVSSTAGELVVNTVPFQYDGWFMMDGAGDPELFRMDLGSVALIGVRITQGGLSAQSYTIDEFKLVADDGSTSEPADLTPLEQALKDRFGVTSAAELTEEQKALDTDGDGLTDLKEILSENDPVYANSIFAANVAEVEEAGVTIKWPCVRGILYTVYRSSNLAEGFHIMPEATDLLASETGFMTYKDTSATGDGPYFYKILKR